MRKRYTVAVGLVLTVAAAVAGARWFVGRMSVATYRHALDHPEAPKDTLGRQIRDACRGEGAKGIWVTKQDSRFVPDPRASSGDVYRYIVLDATLLKDVTCVAAVVTASKAAPYPVQIVFSRDGEEEGNLYFKNEVAKRR
jgi:hypothetical protein